MPELPEVETIRKTLAPHIVGKKIKSVTVMRGNVIKYPLQAEFIREIEDNEIIGLSRRGKYLLITLSNTKLLVIHFRLTGALIFTKIDVEPKYARIKFLLSDESFLWYTDVRTLGTLYLINEDDMRIKGLSTLGPEPLKDKLKYTYFKEKILLKNSLIKALLLDQTFIAGLGNIYVDEALFIAKIRPDRKASSLKENEIKKLYNAVITVIAQGIDNHGTTFRDYKDGDGNKGDNQNYIFVYGKSKTPCSKCDTLLEYTKVAGRGTTYCPKCQK